MTETGKWSHIPLVAMEMNLDLTFASGQAFRWVRGDGGEWSGAIGNRLYTLRHHDNQLSYHVTPPTSPAEDRQTLVDYLRLDLSLSSLYHQLEHCSSHTQHDINSARWSLSDANFKEKAAWCHGVRLLQQPSFETLVAFICSSNNNISRISRMMCSLCERYGECLGECGGRVVHSFPPPGVLGGGECEGVLRDMGFGYRAGYVVGSVREVVRRGGEEWLEGLQRRPYQEAWEELQQLPGVGAKVADCVCLMGLGFLQAVPVDVHVRRLAQRDYGVGHGGRSLTPAVYRCVGDKFRSLFGDTAGWAQAVLFTAELQRRAQGQAGGRKRPPHNEPSGDTPCGKRRARHRERTDH